jgi:P27 family predicted phage terminase small subunit
MIDAPNDFDHFAESCWRRAQDQLRAQGTWEDTDAPLLESYVRSLALSRQAREAVSVCPFVEGSRGQMVAHPGVKVASDADRDAERYARALLLTPESRSRHDVGGEPDGEPFIASLA